MGRFAGGSRGFLLLCSLRTLVYIKISYFFIVSEWNYPFSFAYIYQPTNNSWVPSKCQAVGIGAGVLAF